MKKDILIVGVIAVCIFSYWFISKDDTDYSYKSEYIDGYDAYIEEVEDICNFSLGVVKKKAIINNIEKRMLYYYKDVEEQNIAAEYNVYKSDIDNCFSVLASFKKDYNEFFEAPDVEGDDNPYTDGKADARADLLDYLGKNEYVGLESSMSWLDDNFEAIGSSQIGEYLYESEVYLNFDDDDRLLVDNIEKKNYKY